MLTTCRISENNILRFSEKTPETILDPPSHFSDQQKYRKSVRQKLLLTTSNDPLDASQMLPNNSKIWQANVKISVKILGRSRVLDH